jgi:hypothetical protein
MSKGSNLPIANNIYNTRKLPKRVKHMQKTTALVTQ